MAEFLWKALLKCLASTCRYKFCLRIPGSSPLISSSTVSRSIALSLSLCCYPGPMTLEEVTSLKSVILLLRFSLCYCLLSVSSAAASVLDLPERPLVCCMSLRVFRCLSAFTYDVVRCMGLDFSEPRMFEPALLGLISDAFEARLVLSLSSRLIAVLSSYKLSIVGFASGTHMNELLRLKAESFCIYRCRNGSRILFTIRRAVRD